MGIKQLITDERTETQNTKEAIRYFEKLLGSLKEASAIISDALKDIPNYRPDFLHYKEKIDQLISTDHNEAGIEPLIKNLKNKIMVRKEVKKEVKKIDPKIKKVLDKVNK